ncbi:hypothetical protein Q1695_009291 [Nippostrongylus brasiliensis]|nr:hypothetical protein Q1695_009291 [Nippostrongylus brasiliensis]
MSDLLAKVGEKMSEMEQKLAEVLHLGGSEPTEETTGMLVAFIGINSAQGAAKPSECCHFADVKHVCSNLECKSAGCHNPMATEMQRLDGEVDEVDEVPEVKPTPNRRPTLARRMTIEEEHMGVYFVYVSQFHATVYFV